MNCFNCVYLDKTRIKESEKNPLVSITHFLYGCGGGGRSWTVGWISPQSINTDLKNMGCGHFAEEIKQPTLLDYS